MWFVGGWIYRWRYGKLGFKIRNFTESAQAECRESIVEGLKRITAKKGHFWTRIELKDAKSKMHEFDTDILGRTHKVEGPIFTESEIARIDKWNVIYWGAIALLVLFESFFFSYFGDIMLPPTLRGPLQLFVTGLVFAIVFAMALHLATGMIDAYFKAKYIIERDNLNKVELKKFSRELVFGLVILVLFLIVNPAVAIVRTSMLEPEALTGTAQYAWYAFGVIFPLMFACVMTAAKHELGSRSERLKVYKNWKRQHKERKKYNDSLKQMLEDGENLKALKIVKYWSLVKDLQRVFRVEVDEDRNDLLEEFKASNISTVDDKVYDKFRDIAITDLRLFRFPIDNDPRIVEELADLSTKKEKIEAFELKAKSPDLIQDGSAIPELEEAGTNE